MEDQMSTTSETPDSFQPPVVKVTGKKKKRSGKSIEPEFAIPTSTVMPTKRRSKPASRHFQSVLRLGKLKPDSSVFARAKHAKNILRGTGKHSDDSAVNALRWAIFEYNASNARKALGHLEGRKRLSEQHLETAIRTSPGFFDLVHAKSAISGINPLNRPFAQIPLTTKGKYTPEVVKKLLKNLK